MRGQNVIHGAIELEASGYPRLPLESEKGQGSTRSIFVIFLIETARSRLEFFTETQVI